MKSIRLRTPTLRADRGRMSLRELSRQTGIAESTLSRLETGKTKGIDFATLATLCDFFNVSPGEVLEREQHPGEAGSWL